MKDRVLNFINLLKGKCLNEEKTAFEITEEIYTRGGCYRLYQILKFIFPETIAYKVDYSYMEDRKDKGGNTFIVSHVVSRIDNCFYDIKGEFILDKSDYQRIKIMNKNDHKIASNFCYSFSRRGAIPF